MLVVMTEAGEPRVPLHCDTRSIPCLASFLAAGWAIATAWINTSPEAIFEMAYGCNPKDKPGYGPEKLASIRLGFHFFWGTLDEVNQVRLMRGLCDRLLDKNDDRAQQAWEVAERTILP